MYQVRFYLKKKVLRQREGSKRKENKLAVAQGSELAICQNEFSSTKQQAIIEE